MTTIKTLGFVLLFGLIAAPLVSFASTPLVAHDMYQGECPSITTTLQRGSRDGNDTYVTALQGFLAQYYDMPAQTHVTGYFGALTRSLVIDFQRKHNISPTGIVGPQTRYAIWNTCLQSSATPLPNSERPSGAPTATIDDSTQFALPDRESISGSVSNVHDLEIVVDDSPLHNFLIDGTALFHATSGHGGTVHLDTNTGRYTVTIQPPLPAGKVYYVGIFNDDYTHPRPDEGTPLFERQVIANGFLDVIDQSTMTDPPPVTAVPLTGTAPLTVTFRIPFPSPKPDSYEVFFGDSDSTRLDLNCSTSCPSELTTTHTYKDPGTYIILLEKGSFVSSQRGAPPHTTYVPIAISSVTVVR